MPVQCPNQPILRRPLLGLTACCILGIVGGIFVPALAPRILFLTAVSALVISVAGSWAAYWAVRHLPLSVPPAHSPQPTVYNLSSVRLLPALSLFCLYLAVLLTAWLNVALYLHNPSGRELAALMDQPREGVELSGVITDDPFMRVTWDGTRRTWSFPLRVEAIRRLPSWQKARGTVQISLRDIPGKKFPHYGERWRFAGVLVDNARFPNEPSFARADASERASEGSAKIQPSSGSAGLRWSRLPRPATAGPRGASRPVGEWIKNRYSFAADPSTGVCLAEGQGARLMAWCFQGRRKAGNYLARGIEHRPEVVGLLQALLLGYRQELPDKIRRDFIATGTYHIFAISGQHVAILALFIIVVLQSQRVCRVKWFLYVAPVLIAFTLSTGLSSSAVRGCLMALLVFLGPLLCRKPDLPSAMALAAILILAVDPFQLFDYGFLLSFGVVAGLIVFCPPMLKLLEPWLAPDPWRLEPERPVVQFRRSAQRFVTLLMVSSLAAWAVSTPLIARWFNLFSPIALLANLIIIPVSAFVLLAGFFSILFGTCLPWLGEVFNFTNVVLVSFLICITDGMARIPGGHFFVASPSIWAVLVWFGTLLAWLPGRAQYPDCDIKHGWRRWSIRLAGPALLVAALLGSMIPDWNRVSADITNISGIPICRIKAPGTAHMLVHAGSRFSGRRVVQKLQRQGVNQLSVLVLPAADERHAGGALDILAAFRVKELWCVTTNARSPVFRQVLTVARERGIPIQLLASEGQGAWRGNMAWQYQAASNKFIVRRGETVLKIEWNRQDVSETRSTLHTSHSTRWDKAMLGQDDADMVTFACRNPAGMPAIWRIRCVEPGAVMPGNNDTDGVAWIGLTPGQGLRVDLNESDYRVEPLENR
ncbi:MAG: ComEC/Rec2 family competence protein [Verrucomicrobiota bacterium]